MEVVFTKENFNESTKIVREWIGRNGGKWSVYSALYDNSNPLARSLTGKDIELYAGDESYTDAWHFNSGTVLSLIEGDLFPHYWIEVLEEGKTAVAATHPRTKEWIAQVTSIRDRQLEETNYLLTQLKNGLSRITWDGNNTEEVIVFCLEWLNSSNEKGIRDWKSGKPILYDGEIMELSFFLHYGEKTKIETVELSKGTTVLQAVDPCCELGPMRCLATLLSV